MQVNIIVFKIVKTAWDNSNSQAVFTSFIWRTLILQMIAILKIQPPKLVVFIVIELCRYPQKQDFPNQPKRHKCYIKKVFISNKTNLNIMYNINNTPVLNINRLAFYSKLCLIIASTFSFLPPR